jgi:precorrin-2 dehydrogenase/sirohydrochlorin ferrochelatase
MVIDAYNRKYLKNKHIVIATTDNIPVNELVYKDCRAQNTLVNIADNHLIAIFIWEES